MMTILAHGPKLSIEGFYAIDFLVLIGVIVWFARKPIHNFVTSRRSRIVSEMEEAQALRKEAQEKLDNYEQRLEHIEGEIQEILEKAREAGEEERKRFLVEATATAEQIRSDAKTRLEQEGRKLQLALQEQLVDMAVSEAQKGLETQLTGGHQEQFVNVYIDPVQHVEGGL